MKGNAEELQAFCDELGRWEPAKVRRKLDDGTFLVSFIGWGREHDAIVEAARLRQAIHPFEAEVANASTRGKRTRSERCYLSYLRGLILGALVRFVDNGKEEEGKVKEVDRFRRCLLVRTPDGDRDIHASALLLPDKEKSDTETTHRKRVRRQELRSRNAHTAVQEEAGVQSTAVNKDVGSDLYFTVMNKDGHNVSCGDVVEVATIPVGVKNISKTADGFKAEGILLADRRVTVTAPVDMLKQTAEKGTREIRKYLAILRKEQFHSAVRKMATDADFRRDVRMQQVGSLLRREVMLSLKSKAPQRKVALGPCQYDVDLALFSLDVFSERKSVFSYRNGTLSLLDGILGNKWDIVVDDSRCMFVTQVVFTLGKGDIVAATIYTSVYWGVISGNYREILAKEMAS